MPTQNRTNVLPKTDKTPKLKSQSERAAELRPLVAENVRLVMEIGKALRGDVK